MKNAIISPNKTEFQVGQINYLSLMITTSL